MLELTLAGGGSARLAAFDGQHVVVLSTRAMPPGSTLQGTGGDGSSYMIKVRGCARAAAAEGERFRIEGRFVNLSKEQRARLLGGA
jgi:hypothetical protein